MGKIKIWLIDDQNIRWKCSKDLHPVIALPKVCTQQSITWWWLFDVLYIHDMIIEQDWHHQKSLICIWMACHALVWSRQEQRYEEFKSVLSANLNVQIWCKYFGPKSALFTFFSFHLHCVTWCVTSEDKDMRNSSRANAQLVRCWKVQRCYHVLCKLLSGFCIHPLVHCNAHTQLVNKCMLSCAV